MITYENAMIELNFPGSIGNQKKRRIAELLKALHDENIKLVNQAAQAGDGPQRTSSASSERIICDRTARSRHEHPENE